MSYVEHCKKHGQYHGEICGECFDDLQGENTRLREALEYVIEMTDYIGTRDTIQKKARDALEGK